MDGGVNQYYLQANNQQPAASSSSLRIHPEPSSSTASTQASEARNANSRAVQESKEGTWYLKNIYFNNALQRIITQNYNGPCSFIAICNILLLRGDIEIVPRDRPSVTYDHLSQLVAEYLLKACPDVDISAALTMMPLTQKGMDLNPLFTSALAFRPSGDAGALKLFEQAGVVLVHGWLADPSGPEYGALITAEDYDTAVNLIVEADTVTKGQLVIDENEPGPSTAGPSSAGSSRLPEADQKKVEDALMIRNFLDSTSSQLTYHGLFTLASTIQPGALVALFRNSHLSVLHRREGDDNTLYNLVTDYIFLNEPTVVWERLEDVDGHSSTFVDADFHNSSPAGGDFAGHTAESAYAAALDPATYAEFDPTDRELARQLQHEEDARAQEAYARRQQEHERRRQQQYRSRGGQRVPEQPHHSAPYPLAPGPNGQQQTGPEAPRIKKKKSCLLM